MTPSAPLVPRRAEVPQEFRIPFEDEYFRGLPLRVFRFPDGVSDRRRALVCVPGLAASGRSFARLRPLAARFDLRMLTAPLAQPYPGGPIHTLAEVLVNYLDTLELPVLLGTSFGSLVALNAALTEGRRIRGLVLTAALAGASMVPRRYAAFAGALLAPRPIAWVMAPVAARVLGGNRLDADARRELVRESRLVTSAEMFRRVNAVLSSELSEKLRSLSVPVLLVHGTRDHIIPLRKAREMAALIPGAEYHEIRGAGHLPYLSHPTEFMRLLDPFLEKVFGDGAAAHSPLH